jgi:hypothetical protein
MKKVKICFWLSLLAITSLYASCCAPRGAMKPDKSDKALMDTPAPEVDSKHPESERFLTLTLKFTNPEHLELIYKDNLPRSLNGYIEYENTTNPDRLRFIFPNIDTIDIENPLIQRKEVFEEDKIISLTDTLKHTTFTVGFPLLKSMDTLMIWKISNNKFERPLLKIDIMKQL